MLGIDWKNGQAGGTPLSAENLKLMQSMIEEEIANQVQNLNIKINNMKDTTLYSSSGTKTNFTLIDDISNYKYVEVIAIRGEKLQCSTKAIVNQTGNTSVSLVSTYYGYGNNMWIDELCLSMSGTTATIDNYSSLHGATNSLEVEHSQNISIIKVIGYKEVSE